MKKNFFEPELQRIELNLHENIATSTQTGMGYYFTTTLFACNVVNTGKLVFDVTEAEAAACLITGAMRTVLKFYPVDEVRPHFKK